MKAKYIGKITSKYSASVDLMYEYRGRTYFVTDPHNGYSESLRKQHLYEQHIIDLAIESEGKEHLPGTFDLSVLDLMYEEV